MAVPNVYKKNRLHNLIYHLWRKVNLFIRYLKLPRVVRKSSSRKQEGPFSACDIAVFDKITLVLPLKDSTHNRLSELERVSKILFPSLRKNLDPKCVDKFILIVPQEDYPNANEVARQMDDCFNFQIVEDDDLAPSLTGTSGWDKQQILKIAVSNIVSTSFFLVLDCDNIMIKKASYSDFVVNGLAKHHIEPMDIHFAWWHDSARILGLNPNEIIRTELASGPTPQILSTEVCRMLQVKLEEVFNCSQWQNVLMRWPGWSEYALYCLFLTRHLKAMESYHCLDHSPILGACVWSAEQDLPDPWVRKNWEEQDFYFTLHQSRISTRSIDEIVELIN